MKRVFALVLCLCLFLTACATQPEQTTPPAASTTPTTKPATDPSVEPTADPTVEPTVEPTTEPAKNFRHPITGQWLAEPCTVRPVAVVTNNYRDAQPVLGISHADIVFEHITEGLGSETRMLAVYTDLNFSGKLGTIRSARTYSLDLASVFNAIFVHCGGSGYAEEQIKKTKYPSFDQFYNDDFFYRDDSRLAANYLFEHTLITECSLLRDGFSTKKWDLTVPAETTYGFTFSDTADLKGSAAKTVTIQYYNKDGKYTIMEYDQSSGMYYGLQKWYKKQGAVADGNTNDPVPFKNVLILKTAVSFAPNGSNTFQKLTGEGEGYLVRDGQYVPIKWKRASTSEPFTYMLTDGSPVTFGVGKTFVSILPTKSPDVLFA